MPSTAVPDVDKVTVTSEEKVEDIVAVSVNEDPEFSAIPDEEEVHVTVGVVSFSVTVIVTDCDPLSEASAPETPEIATTAVSSPS